MLPISTEAVVLAPLCRWSARRALVVVGGAGRRVVVEPPGGLAVELQPASTKAATAGARASAASLDESVSDVGAHHSSIPLGWSHDSAVPQPGTCWSRLVMPSSRPRSQRNGVAVVIEHRLVIAVDGDVVRDRVRDDVFDEPITVTAQQLPFAVT